MLEIFLCGMNLSCQIESVQNQLNGPKYPPDVAELCYYFEKQKTDLPEYCFYKHETFIPRRRSEF